MMYDIWMSGLFTSDNALLITNSITTDHDQRANHQDERGDHTRLQKIRIYRITIVTDTIIYNDTDTQRETRK